MPEDVEAAYLELELPSAASLADVKSQHHLFANAWHPDRQPENLRARAEEKMSRVNHAVDVIKQHLKNRSSAGPSYAEKVAAIEMALAVEIQLAKEGIDAFYDAVLRDAEVDQRRFDRQTVKLEAKLEARVSADFHARLTAADTARGSQEPQSYRAQLTQLRQETATAIDALRDERWQPIGHLFRTRVLVGEWRAAALAKAKKAARAKATAAKRLLDRD